MMLFRLEAFLLFLACNFVGIDCGPSKETTGNCSFDENTLCSWSNDNDTDHFDWQLRRGRSPSNNTGPISDHSGHGSYIYIDTSLPRKYNEKARLNSPWMRGAQRMTFYYSMYGSTVESLSVYIRFNGNEKRIWSRYGNHLSSNWTKGCVSVNNNGTYQVIIEGVAGVTFTSDIAVDDVTFSTNLTCVSVGKPTPPETFEVNCTFDESYCGWRKILTSLNDQISWYRKRSGNQSQGTGPSQDHTGGGEYIYVHKSQSSQVNQPAQLLSPLIRGPKCLRFYYYMNGSDIGNLDVLLWLREQKDHYLMWRRSGEQGDQWMKASVDVGYTGESQFSFQATIGRNYTGGIALDHVTLSNGLCKDQSEPQINRQGNCDFDSNFCFWRNYLNFKFTWTPRRYHTPSSQTGPSADHTSGIGMYVYIETSSPRQPGDTARLESPWMRGPQCMTFYYHMYGATMSCVVIYIKSQATNRLKPVWLRSQDQGDQWIQGKISINETSSYQIIVDGIRGSSSKGDAALDDVSFERGTCNQTEETLFYVYSYNGKDFRIFTQPSEHSLYFEEFRFTLEHPRGHPNETTYFIYSDAPSGQSFVTSNFDTSGYKKFPLDVVFLNDERVGNNSRRVYLIDRSNYGTMMSLHDHGNVICCKGRQTSFYAHNVTEEFSGHTMGVLREVWSKVYFNPRRIATLREHPVFKTSPRSQMILRDFDSPVDVEDLYVQRLTSYLQVPDSGNYTFYLSCDDRCELWMYDVFEYGTENQNKKAEESLTKQPIIAVHAWTGHLQWNKYPQQQSEPIFLDKNRFYEMKVFMYESWGEDHASLGMRKPSGEYERPISGTRLFWTKPVGSLSQNNKTQSSSVLLPFDPFMAIDRSYATCYRSEKESNPWWQVTLEKTLYVESVEIADNIDCCPREIGMINVTVSSSPFGFNPTCAESMEYGDKTKDYKFLCSPPARGSYVTVTLFGDNVTLVLCQVVVKTIEFPREARGVLRESWYNVNFNMNGIPTMRQHPVYKTLPQSEMTLQDFDAPVDVGDHYVQLLTSYLQVPDSGNYTFYLSCDDWCELWKYDVDEDGIENRNKKSEESLIKQPIIALYAWTGYLQWNKYSNQMSQPIFLDKCRVYQMEVFMRETVGRDHASVGMRRPSGEYERPIPGTRLFRTNPGIRRLKVTLQDHETRLSSVVGSNLRISGFYQFCCEGVYCPDCPLELNISTLGQNITLNSVLNLSCVNTSFTATFNTDRHPGNYAVKISYSFIDNPQQIIGERVIGHVHFPGNDCNFDINFCNWRNDANFSFTWTLRRCNTPNSQTGPSADHTSGTGMYVYIETASPREPGDTARLESPWMRGPQCMTFYYHMYGATMSCLVIYIRSRATNKLKPVWLRSQDQGDQWIQGHISISETSSYQIIVDGIRGSSDKGDAALDDISFERGTCNQTEETLFYVYSYNGKDFRIFTQPSQHNLYFEEFRFTLGHPRGHPNETAYFVYSKASSGQSFVTSKLDSSSYDRFPLDVVVLNSKRVGGNSRRVYLIDRSNYGPMISLYDHGNVICCKGKQTFSFYAHNVTEEFLGQARGVFREAWYLDYLQSGVATIREQPVFKTPPQYQIILRDFDAPVNVGNYYVQRLTSYLQVPDSGNYTFYVSCDDWCELWMYDLDEFGMESRKKKADENVTAKLIIALYAWTGYLQWNKYRQQVSQPIFLDKSHTYQMEVFMRETVGGDHASVGMRTPSGEYERPIRGTRLFWTKPVSSLSQIMTQGSSVLLPFDPFMAIDRSYATCYRSEKESNPWWQVTLKKTLYVESVEITDKIDCCHRDIGMINITVSTSPTGLDPTCTESMEYGGKTQDYKFLCSPPARGSYVKVTLIGDSVTLVLCHVVVKTIEFIEQARGVLREVWYKANMDLDRVATMRQHPVFDSPPQSQMILHAFDAPVHVGNYYVQRLTSYLQVPESGNYTFYVSCDNWCELWKYDVHDYDTESQDKKAEESLTKQPIIAFDAWTGHLQWNKYPQQVSQPFFLDKCRIYIMEVFMYERWGADHVSVGMRKPSGEYERPVPNRRLFWTKPGIRRLKVTLQDNEKLLSGVVGSRLRISGFYQFCCEGVYCPDCPLELNISTLGQNVTLNSELDFSCINTSFTATFNTDRQPGESAIKVSYSSVNNCHASIDERVLGHVHVQAAILEECSFDLEYCGWTSVGENDKWKLSLKDAFIKYPGSFAYIDNSYKARSISPLLPWKPFHQSVGVCLRFNYLMPTKSKSNLKVFLRNTKQEMLELVWKLVGYHGKEWSGAQVAWPGAVGSQIIFEGEGFLGDEMNLAIDNVLVTTENCSLRPYFAEPDFRCSNKEFTCKNGECIQKNLLCDGDFACKDESDEDDCGCPSSMFHCQGGACLLATAVCDGKIDCSNGDDENNCRNPCPSSHHCVDGSCVSWSKTCTQTAFCRDGTNTPSVCGSGKCHLNDLACNSTKPTRCESFRGHCGFQNGLCGLKSDRNASFHWTVGSGKTLTESTGPNYDHTSFNEDGSYIFIEVSQKNTGDKARLLSDEMEPNKNVCVQFWYHMRGSDTGNLSIYVKTNQSETLVWRLSGDQGNRWRFGQTALNSPSLYQFVIEGTVGNGSRGDIAVDDLTVMDGVCDEIITQASPDCDFEENLCNWRAEQGWVLKTRVEGFETSGGFVASLPAGASNLPSSLSSPVINFHYYEWKCLRFWYFIGATDARDWHTTSLLLLLRTVTSNQTVVLFFADGATDKARYTQIPLPRNSTNSQIFFEGFNKLPGGQFLAIDDVSFSKEPCKQIPPKQDGECQKDLGMENGAISDRQITASSQWNSNHAPFQGRLNFQNIAFRAGSWSARRNDLHQWLQVDLGSQHTKVTRVATQGRNDAAQWVTKYKLQYSNDGVNFHYYMDPRKKGKKDFAGNADQGSVVYHELNPPIRARYIRFRPEAWHGHISMRVELYGCRRGWILPFGTLCESFKN